MKLKPCVLIVFCLVGLSIHAENLTTSRILSLRTAERKNLVALLDEIDSLSLPLSVMSLWQMLIDVQIGTPPQIVSLAIDSSTPYALIPSTSCITPRCSGLSLSGFTESNSSTYVTQGIRLKKRIDDYVMSISNTIGVDGTDLFNIGGHNFSGHFELVSDTDASKPQLMYNGRLGFGFTSSPTTISDSLLPGLFQGHSSKVISYYIYNFSAYGVVGGFELGTVNMGLVDSSTWVTKKNYSPSENSWGLQITNLVLNGIPLGMNGYALVHTAVPFLVMPKSSFNLLSSFLNIGQYGGQVVSNNQENGGIYYKVPCGAISSMPTITLYISGTPFAIPPSIYIVGDGTDCISLLYGLDVGTWVFGVGVQRGLLMALDFDAGTISYGKLIL